MVCEDCGVADTAIAPPLVKGDTTPLALLIGERAAEFMIQG